MSTTALMIVDVQNTLMDYNPYNGVQLIETLKVLIKEARENEIEVIYIQHCTKDNPIMAPGSEGWQVYEPIKPLETEKCVSKYFSSSFRQTELKEYLDKRGITDLIITGMQTEYCVDTTIRVAFEHGYEVIIPEGSNTTYDYEDLEAKQIVMHHNQHIFDNRFGKVMPLNEVLLLMRNV